MQQVRGGRRGRVVRQHLRQGLLLLLLLLLHQGDVAAAHGGVGRLRGVEHVRLRLLAATVLLHKITSSGINTIDSIFFFS